MGVLCSYNFVYKRSCEHFLCNDYHALLDLLLLQDLLVKDQRNKMEQGENGLGNSVEEDEVATVRHERENCDCGEMCCLRT